MTTVKANAHVNELTKGVKNDFYLTPSLGDTFYTDDILNRLKKKEIATENVNGKAFVQVFLRECAEAVNEEISPNMPKKLQFVLPTDVYPGEWRIKVATQFTHSSGQFTKDVREYEYPNIVTVI
jgi:hypothetical protein